MRRKAGGASDRVTGVRRAVTKDLWQLPAAGCTACKAWEGRTDLTQSRILVVEDEPNIVESLRFILAQAGFAVDVSGDGADALRRMLSGHYQAVVLDIMLPGLNGFDVLKAVRADPRLAGLPVIVLTAKGQATDRRSAEEIGASAFITKPFANADVVAQVRNLAIRT
jgi:DNA-binding response OmpR family regulator